MSVFVPHHQHVPMSRLVALTLCLLLAISVLLIPQAADVANDLTASPITHDVTQLPLSFVPNVGQTDPAVQFQAQGLGGTIFFTSDQVVLSLPVGEATTTDYPGVIAGHVPTAASELAVVRVQFDGANAAPTLVAAEALPGTINYLQGDDPAQWRTDVPTYAGVVYHNLYDGIDLRYDGTQGQLKSTYTVAPGIDPDQIGWRYSGAQQVQIDRATGNLQISLPMGQTLTEQAPVAWQVIDGKQVPVDVRYQLASDQRIGFAVGSYNPVLPLVIDPILEAGTFLGGEGNDAAWDITVDGDGNIYLAGLTNSPNFPARNGYDGTFNGRIDAFVAKLSPNGRSLEYATYLGGTDEDLGFGIAVDGSGNAYVSGITRSTNFPTTADAFDRTLGNGTACQDPIECNDNFVAKLSARGNALVYSTYLGGKSSEASTLGPRVAVDTAGNAYITGRTGSSDFPITPGAFDQTLELDPFSKVGADVFVTKLNARGTALVYSTFLGGPTDAEEGRDIAVDGTGNAYVVGLTFGGFPIKNAVQPTSDGSQDVFVTKVNANGSDLLYSTYLGGNDYDYPGSIAIDQTGNAYMSGHTFSQDFPVKNALQPRCKRCDPGENTGYDAYITKLNPQGNAFVYSTYLGGTGLDDAFGLAVDAAGQVHVAGTTTSNDFPTRNAVHARPGDLFNGYVAKLSADGQSLIYSTYLGGSEADFVRGLALDAAGSVYATGETFSANFPIRHPLQPRIGGHSDTFVVKLSERAGEHQIYLPIVSR